MYLRLRSALFVLFQSQRTKEAVIKEVATIRFPISGSVVPLSDKKRPISGMPAFACMASRDRLELLPW